MSQKSYRTAVYPGTFDPITNGHLDLVARASLLFHEVVLAIAKSPNKNPAFDLAARVSLATEALKSHANVRVVGFDGLLADFVHEMRAGVVLRGLRAVSDFEYEFQMTMMNRHLKSNIETIFMMAGEAHFYTSSRLVKEVVTLGGDVEGLVPDVVLKRLKDKVRA